MRPPPWRTTGSAASGSPGPSGRKRNFPKSPRGLGRGPDGSAVIPGDDGGLDARLPTGDATLGLHARSTPRGLQEVLVEVVEGFPGQRELLRLLHDHSFRGELRILSSEGP